jgi:hypothetical protein
MDQANASKKSGIGKHNNHVGRSNLRTRAADAALARYKHPAPHVSLYRMGHDTKLEMPLRIHALAASAPFFAPKHAPSPTPRFLAGEPDLGRLTDAASAVVFVASVAECARTGKLDAEWARIFADLADVYVRLYDKLHLEVEVERHRQLEHAGA